METLKSLILTGNLFWDIIIISLYCFSLYALYRALTTKSKNKLSVSDESLDVSATLKCPNCKNDTWIEGPGGGSFGNIKCCKCNNKYNNLGIFGLQEIK